MNCEQSDNKKSHLVSQVEDGLVKRADAGGEGKKGSKKTSKEVAAILLEGGVLRGSEWKQRWQE